MIKSISHKGLRQLWESGKNSKLPFDQINRIKQMLEVIDSAQNVPQDFEFFKSWRIHPLKGQKKGYWSLSVKENWRIIFRFVAQDAFDLDYIDYH
ncbi:MAG: type II toxin-antitoxin system RelE/ParE family toxin [Ginsengibacter sp.]